MPETATQIETRTVQLESIELRAPTDAQEGQAPSRKLVGRAVVYNQAVQIRSDFQETIKPGAAAEVLNSDANIRALYEHDPRSLLGSTAAGSLKLTDGPEGLDFELDVAETRTGDDVLALVRRGELRGMSFAFKVAEDRWSEDYENRRINREIVKLERMPEITLTSIPYYPSTSVEARSIDPAAIEKANELRSRPTLAHRREQVRRLMAAV